MKAVVQIVQKAKLEVADKLISKIDKGFVVFFGVEKGDDESKLDYFVKKISKMRVFKDENDKTNLSIHDVNGQVLLVSQFTLAADYEHGNRPSFSNAEGPERAKELYLQCAKLLENEGLIVKLGAFGEHMIIEQVNEGPFTIILQK